MDLATLGLRLEATPMEMGAQRVGQALRDLDRQTIQTTQRIAGLQQSFAGFARAQSGLYVPAGMENLRQTTAAIEGAAIAAPKATAGLAGLRMGLTSLAATSLGTNTAVSRMGSSLLVFGTGTAATLGILAGLAAIGYAFQRLTERNREAKQRLDEYREAYRALIEVQRAQAQGDLATLQAEQTRLRQGIERWRQTAAGIDPTSPGGAAQARVVSQMLKQLEQDFIATSEAVAGAIVTVRGFDATLEKAAAQERAERQAIEEKNAALQESTFRYERARAAVGSYRAAFGFESAGFGRPLDFFNYRAQQGLGTPFGFTAGGPTIEETQAQAVRALAEIYRLAATGSDQIREAHAVMLEGMQHALTDFYIQAEYDGAAAFGRLFAEIGRLWAERLQAMEKLTPKQVKNLGIAGAAFTGFGVGVSTGNIGAGLLSGALAGAEFGGVGAVVGGAAGFLGGLGKAIFGAGQAAQEAAQRFQDLQRSLQSSIEAFALELGGTPLQRAMAGVRNQADDLRRLAQEAFEGTGRAGAAAYAAELLRINQLEALRLLQLQALENIRQRELQEDYEVRRLRAAGFTAEADALAFAQAHQREYAAALRDGATAVTLAALAEAQAAEAAQRAADVARAALRGLEDLEVRRFRAVGFGDEADALAFALQQQREYEDAIRAGADATTLATLAEVQRVEALRWNAETQIALQQREADAAQQALEGLRRTIDTLRGFSRDVQMQTASPFDQVRLARAEFERVAAIARTGDQAAAAQLPELARIFLEASRAYNASGGMFQVDAGYVRQVLDELATMFEGQATVEQQKLDAALAAIAIQQSILDALNAVATIQVDTWAYQREQEEEEWARQRAEKQRREEEENTQHRERIAKQDETIAELVEQQETLFEGFKAVTNELILLRETTETAAQLTKRTLEGMTLA